MLLKPFSDMQLHIQRDAYHLKTILTVMVVRLKRDCYPYTLLELVNDKATLENTLSVPETIKHRASYDPEFNSLIYT